MAKKYLTRGRRVLAVLLSGGLLAGVVAVSAAGPAHAVATAPAAGLNAVLSGTELHVHAVQAPPKIADVDEAFSLSAIDSTPGGFKAGTKFVNEVNEGILPTAGKNVFARGGGAEVGVGEPTPNDATKRLLELTTAETAAPTAAPPYTSGLLDNTKNTVDLKGALDPLANASALGGRAAALWNPNYLFPTLGNPLTYAYGQAADAQVLNTAASPSLDQLGNFLQPVLSLNTSPTGPNSTVASSQSFSYLVNNGDGTCGLAAEIHMTIAPVNIGVASTLITVGGDWIMKAVATGKSTGNSFSYGPDPKQSPSTPLISVKDTTQSDPAKQLLAQLTVQDILGPTGLVLPSNPLIDLAVGEAPRGIYPPKADGSESDIPGTPAPPTHTATAVSAAADVLRLRLLQGAAPPFQAADLRLGHFEMKMNVPSGGINCEIPVGKASNVPVANTGQDLLFTVKIPVDPKAVEPFPCDMTNVKVSDLFSLVKADTPSKPPRMNFVKGVGPHGEVGTVSADKQSITFGSLGTWKPGDAPLVVTITATVPTTSGTGIVKDEATATASAGNCSGKKSVLGNVIGLITGDLTGAGNGTVAGTANFFGSNGVGLTGKINGSGPVDITGRGTLNGPPVVLAKVLAVTGDRHQNLYLGLALAAIASAVGFRRLRRRAHSSI